MDSSGNNVENIDYSQHEETICSQFSLLGKSAFNLIVLPLLALLSLFRMFAAQDEFVKHCVLLYLP